MFSASCTAPPTRLILPYICARKVYQQRRAAPPSTPFLHTWRHALASTPGGHPSLHGSVALASSDLARRHHPRALRPRPPSTPGGRPSLRRFGGGGGETRSRVATSPAAAMALPPLSIRGDWGVISTAAGRYAPSLLQSFLQMGPHGALGTTKLLRPFSEIVDSLELKNPFVHN